MFGAQPARRQSRPVLQRPGPAPRRAASLLPDYQVVIFDEAHTLEDVAADHLGLQVARRHARLPAQQALQPAQPRAACSPSSRRRRRPSTRSSAPAQAGRPLLQRASSPGPRSQPRPRRGRPRRPADSVRVRAAEHRARRAFRGADQAGHAPRSPWPRTSTRSSRSSSPPWPTAAAGWPTRCRQWLGQELRRAGLLGRDDRRAQRRASSWPAPPSRSARRCGSSSTTRCRPSS